MAEKQEGYLCPKCQELNQTYHLKYMYISLVEMVLKCENPICMFPFRDFQFKHLENTDSATTPYVTNNTYEDVNVLTLPETPIEKIVTPTIRHSNIKPEQNDVKGAKNTKPKNISKMQLNNNASESASSTIARYLESIKAKHKKIKSMAKNSLNVKDEKNKRTAKLHSSFTVSYIAENMKKGVQRPLDILSTIQRL